MICSDAFFAVNIDNLSQLSVLAMMRDMTTGSANIAHYMSCKRKRVCKSVLASEHFAFIEGFDNSFSICHPLQSIFDKMPELSIYTDSQFLHVLCISLAQITGRRLQINLSIIRKAYERREIDIITWTADSPSSADDVTKRNMRDRTLAKLVPTNKFAPTEQIWVHGDGGQVQTRYNYSKD